MTDTVRSTYRELSGDEKIALGTNKCMGQEFLDFLTACGSNRELSIAKTKIEEAVMWASKGITG